MQTIPGIELRDLNIEIDLTKKLSESIRTILSSIHGQNLWGFYFNTIEIESAKNLVKQFLKVYLEKSDSSDFSSQAVIVKVKNLVDSGSFGLAIEFFEEAAGFHRERCDKSCEKITPDYIFARVFSNIALSLRSES